MTISSGGRMAGEAEVADVAPGDLGAPGRTGTAGTMADGRWSEIQATFVDDPRAAVTEAASLLDEAIEAHIAAVRERQASLASSWQAQDAGTEQLRAAFREYRTFWHSVNAAASPTAARRLLDLG